MYSNAHDMRWCAICGMYLPTDDVEICVQCADGSSSSSSIVFPSAVKPKGYPLDRPIFTSDPPSHNINAWAQTVHSSAAKPTAKLTHAHHGGFRKPKLCMTTAFTKPRAALSTSSLSDDMETTSPRAEAHTPSFWDDKLLIKGLRGLLSLDDKKHSRPSPAHPISSSLTTSSPSTPVPILTHPSVPSSAIPIPIPINQRHASRKNRDFDARFDWDDSPSSSAARRMPAPRTPSISKHYYHLAEPEEDHPAMHTRGRRAIRQGF